MELFGLILALTVILIVTSKWHNVIYALLLGMLVIIIFSSMSLQTIFTIFLNVTFNFNTLSLVTIVLLISFFGAIMYKTLFLEKLLNSLFALLKSIQLLITLIPTIVGFLAVPGGSILSAPFVDELGNRINMNAGYKSGVNVFFRHLAVFFNPLSTIMIVVADISTVGFLPLIKFHFFPVIITFLISLVVIYRFWPNPTDTENNNQQQKSISIKKAFGEFLFSGAPLILALTLTIVFSIHFIIALLLAILVNIIFDYKTVKLLKASDFPKLIFKDVNWNLGLAVYTIHLFGEFVKYSDAIPILAEIITTANMPLLLIIVLTSILVGFTTGHPMVGAAIVYPIFLPLVGPENTVYLSLLLTGMMFGYVVSPVHLCLIVSNEYFNAKYLDSNKILFPLQALLLVLAIIFAIII